MKTNKMNELTTQELEARVREYKTELFNLRFQHATGQLPNAMVIRDCKRNIARAKTILRERELNAQNK